MNDLEILQNRQPLPIGEIAAQLGLGEEDLEYYGKYKAKVHLDVLAKPAKEN